MITFLLGNKLYSKVLKVKTKLKSTIRNPFTNVVERESFKCPFEKSKKLYKTRFDKIKQKLIPYTNFRKLLPGEIFSKIENDKKVLEEDKQTFRIKPKNLSRFDDMNKSFDSFFSSLSFREGLNLSLNKGYKKEFSTLGDLIDNNQKEEENSLKEMKKLNPKKEKEENEQIEKIDKFDLFAINYSSLLNLDTIDTLEEKFDFLKKVFREYFSYKENEKHIKEELILEQIVDLISAFNLGFTFSSSSILPLFPFSAAFRATRNSHRNPIFLLTTSVGPFQNHFYLKAHNKLSKTILSDEEILKKLRNCIEMEKETGFNDYGKNNYSLEGKSTFLCNFGENIVSEFSWVWPINVLENSTVIEFPFTIGNSEEKECNMKLGMQSVFDLKTFLNSDSKSNNIDSVDIEDKDNICSNNNIFDSEIYKNIIDNLNFSFISSFKLGKYNFSGLFLPSNGFYELNGRFPLFNKSEYIFSSFQFCSKSYEKIGKIGIKKGLGKNLNFGACLDTTGHFQSVWKYGLDKFSRVDIGVSYNIFNRDKSFGVLIKYND